MNHVILSGRLTRDPDLLQRGGHPICKMRVAVDNGEQPTTYVDVATFDRSAQACAEYLSKGRRVGVSGILAQSEWRDAEDKRHERHSVIGRVEFLDRPPAQAESPAPTAPRTPASRRQPAPAVKAEADPTLEKLQLALAAV